MSSSSEEIILGFKLASGDFSSELRMSLPKTKKDADRAVARWLDFMATGLRLSAERMDAQFPASEPDTPTNADHDGSPDLLNTTERR